MSASMWSDGGVERVEDGEALGRPALAALLQERAEPLADLVELGLGKRHGVGYLSEVNA